MFAPVQHLRDQSASKPDAPALIATDHTWTFGDVARTVAAVAQRLRSQGIGPRQLVAIDLPAAEDWIVTLALFRLAAPSVSVSGVGDLSGIHADALLTRPGTRRLTASLVVEIDRLWLDQVVADAEESGSPEGTTVLFARADAVCRVIATSGTTGSPRAAELSVRAVTHRLDNLHHYWTDARPEMNLMALSTTGGFHTAVAHLKHGTPYLAVDAADARQVSLAAAAGVEVLAGSPVQIGHLLGVVRTEGLSIPTLREVRMAGAAASPALLAAIAEHWNVPVRGVYGSTEGGGVTMRMMRSGHDSADVGHVVPGVELDIVDEAGESVGVGTVGDVRYRGAGLATGYRTGDPEQSFRRGWFHSGDRGVITADGSLVLKGRTAELVNVGGVKIDPGRVDAAVEGFPGVVDAGTFIIEQTPGIAELGLAVVADANCDLRALDQLLRQRLPGAHPTVFGQVSVIPRNRMGKVERMRLTADFRRRLGLD